MLRDLVLETEEGDKERTEKEHVDETTSQGVPLSLQKLGVGFLQQVDQRAVHVVLQLKQTMVRQVL